MEPDTLVKGFSINNGLGIHQSLNCTYTGMFVIALYRSRRQSTRLYTDFLTVCRIIALDFDL